MVKMTTTVKPSITIMVCFMYSLLQHEYTKCSNLRRNVPSWVEMFQVEDKTMGAYKIWLLLTFTKNWIFLQSEWIKKVHASFNPCFPSKNLCMNHRYRIREDDMCRNNYQIFFIRHVFTQTVKRGITHYIHISLRSELFLR